MIELNLKRSWLGLKWERSVILKEAFFKLGTVNRFYEIITYDFNRL